MGGAYKVKMAKYKKTASYRAFAEQKKAKKAMKKPKDKNAPKRPMSSYFVFLKEVRPSVVEDNEDLSIGEIRKTIGKMWGNLDDAKKAKYQAKANKLKSAYEKKLAAYK